jgi:hypothetical protein
MGNQSPIETINFSEKPCDEGRVGKTEFETCNSKLECREVSAETWQGESAIRPCESKIDLKRQIGCIPAKVHLLRTVYAKLRTSKIHCLRGRACQHFCI